MSEICFLAVKCGDETILINVANIKSVIRTKKGNVIIIDTNDMDYRTNCTFEEIIEALGQFLGVTIHSVAI